MVGLLLSIALLTADKPACPALASQHDPALDREAERHAEYMAAVRTQGHQGFEQRYQRLAAKFPGRKIAEICFESWDWQANSTSGELWREAAVCWRQSPGHWSVARTKHRQIGAGLAKGRNGIWYGCIIAVD
jgi:uncharacterized protein YkwD